MKGIFRTSLFGYRKKQVKEHIARMNSEHENALALKNERFVQMRDENNILKVELARLRGMEQEISSVLITARTTANELIHEGERSAEAEKARLADQIHSLDGLSHALYEKLEYVIQQAQDISQGFEKEMNDLLINKEAFLKSSYPFDK